MSPYPRPGEKVEPTKRTPRDGVEYVPSSTYPESYSHNADNPFPNDLLHFPHATTDIHAHVMVCDLIDDERSVAMIADAWHLTFAQTDHIASLPIVNREVEALKKLVKLRAELMSLVYGDRAIRSLARVANMPLLEPESRGYTEQAANTRASLVRLASTALLNDARRRAAPTRAPSTPTTPTRTANASERASSPGGTAVGGQSGGSDASPVPSKSAPDFDAAASSPSDSVAPDAPPAPHAAHEGGPIASEDVSSASDVDSRVACLGEDQACSDNSSTTAHEGGPLASEDVISASDVDSRVACLGEDQACSDNSSTTAHDPHDPHDNSSPPPSPVPTRSSSPPSATPPLSSSPRSSASSASSAFTSSSSPSRSSRPDSLPPSSAPRPSALSADSAVPLSTPTSRARDHRAA